MNRKTILSTLFVAASMGLAVAAAWGDTPARSQLAPPDNGQARLTMAQAVTIAEVRLEGRVVEARLDDTSAPAAFKFKLVNAANQHQHARVAAYGGQLLASAQDGRHHGN